MQFMLSLLLSVALSPTQQVTRIVVKKSDHTLTLYHDQVKLQSYRISLGSWPALKMRLRNASRLTNVIV
jgi:hypothetical protein